MKITIPHSILLLFCVFIFTSCTGGRSDLVVDASNVELELINGVLEYKGIPFDGRLITRYKNNSLESEIDYSEGRKNGEEKQWYSDGTPAVLRSYTQGFKSGVHKGWWPDGTLKFEYHFNENGEYDGAVNEWYASGQQFKAFNYTEGEECGSQKLWKEDGSIKANYDVRNGERFGLIGLKKCYSLTSNSDELN